MKRSGSLSAGVLGAIAGSLAVGLILPLVVDEDRDSNRTAIAGGSSAAVPREAAGHARVGVSPDAAGPESTDGTAATSDAARAGGPGAATAPAGGGPASGAAAGSQDPTDGPRTASDVGVTPEEIKLGFVLLDLSTARSVGLAPAHYEVETQRNAYQAQVDAINAAGGLHGRRTRAVYAVADPFQRDSALAACVKLAQDEKVFAAIAFAGFTADGMLCLARQHKTPTIVFGTPPEEHFRVSEGRLVSDGMGSRRIMFNWVHELDRLELLQGKKIGVVGGESTSNGDKQAVEEGLLPALDQYDYQVTYRVRLSEDLPTAATQIPQEVARMRSSGVDFVFLPTSFIYSLQWVQAAHGQGWRPQYTVSDYQGLTSDVVLEDMPDSFEGAFGFTDSHFVRGAREGMAEPAIDRACRETYNRATGERWRWGDRHPLFNACVQLEIYVRSMLAAGRNPTRASWARAVPTLGEFPLATKHLGGFPGRHDYGGRLSTIRWQARCKCYNTIEPPRPSRY